MVKHGPQRFHTVIATMGTFGDEVDLTDPENWVNDELMRYAGNLVACRVNPRNGPSLSLVSVYSPAWPVDRGRLEGVNVGSIRLVQNGDLWVAYLLGASLRTQLRTADAWIVTGDFIFPRRSTFGREGRGAIRNVWSA